MRNERPVPTPQILELVRCPSCRGSLSDSTCRACAKIYGKEPWMDLCLTQDATNQATEAAYRIYSKYYAPVALLAYWIVWRGKFLRHVAFFRGLLGYGKQIVDIATGDASLTTLALFRSREPRAEHVLALDISGFMLHKARKKLPRNRATILRADALNLPFADHSLPLMSCFGGLNSFPSGETALSEVARVLAKDGVLRGSLLLLPQSNWRRNLVLSWIEKGYQTEVIDEAKFGVWVKRSGLVIQHGERHGDVLLFELRHPQA